MIVEVIAVGTELLLGQIVNSNTATMGAALAERGFDAHYQQTVGDNLGRIASAIGTALDRSDAVVITGGIGPTQDDITREAVCAVTGREMVFSEEYAEHLREWWARRAMGVRCRSQRQADLGRENRVVGLEGGAVAREGECVDVLEGEACDLGPFGPGNGCDASCQIEPCFACEGPLGEPSSCFQHFSGEPCDLDGRPCTVDTCVGATDELGAEILGNSMLVEDNAYDVIPGFLGDPIGDLDPGLQAAPPPAQGGDGSGSSPETTSIRSRTRLRASARSCQ